MANQIIRILKILTVSGPGDHRVMIRWSRGSVGVAIISRILQLDRVETTAHVGPTGHNRS